MRSFWDFKNPECFNRVREAQVIWEQIDSTSIILANKLASTPGIPNTTEAPLLRRFFCRHFAWLTVLRFNLRETKKWENIHKPGNKKFLAALPTPESRSVLNDELAAYLPEDELHKLVAHRGDKATYILEAQFRALGKLFAEKVFPVNAALNQNAIDFTPSPDEVARRAYFSYVNERSPARARRARTGWRPRPNCSPNET